jgi:phosphate transport system protein
MTSDRADDGLRNATLGPAAAAGSTILPPGAGAPTFGPVTGGSDPGAGFPGPASDDEPLGGSSMPRSARPLLDRDEREVKDNVLRMGALVEEQIRAAIRSLVEHDAEGASAVTAGDRQINEAQRNVVALITRVIATQQPVARDLRFLLALDHVAYELERMGDHAASVAKQARKLAHQPALKRYVDLPQMGETVAHMVHGVLRALVDVDEAKAREVAAGDDEVDRLYHAIFDELLELMRAHPDNVDRGARLLFAAHYLERIGDRVTNIAEDVVFLASGEISDLND